MKTFMELYLTCQIPKEKIDDYIDAWHDAADYSNLELAEWLGMSSNMYRMFVETPKEFFERYTPFPPTLRDKQ